MFAKFDLAALQNSLILQEIFLQCGNTNSHVCYAIVDKRCQFNSHYPDKNKQVANALDTIRRSLQREGADTDTFFCLEKKL